MSRLSIARTQGEPPGRRPRRLLAVLSLVLPLSMAAALATVGAAAAQTQPSSAGQATSNTYNSSAGSGPAPSDSGAPIDPLAYDWPNEMISIARKMAGIK